MKKITALLLAMALCLTALAGCSQSNPQGSDTPPSGSTQGVDSPDTPKDPVTVTVWHDGDEGIMQTIADQVNAQLADDRITVVFEKKADMPNQLKLYGGDAANAPDLYFYAHDVLGSFVAMDILAPRPMWWTSPSWPITWL